MATMARVRWVVLPALLASAFAHANALERDVCAGGVFTECFSYPSERWVSYGATPAFDRLRSATPDRSPLPDGYAEVVRNVGPLGYYFLYPPQGELIKMRVKAEGGRTGTMEWTGSGDRIRVHLQKGLNRVELVVAASNRQHAKTLHYFLEWTGN